MSALDGLDDLAAWLDARTELVQEWLECCEFGPCEEPQPVVAAVVLPRGPAILPPAFAGAVFGSDGGPSSGGGSSGRWSLAA